MKRKVSAEDARENPITAALDTATRAIDKQQQLQERIRDLEREKEALQHKLDDIADVIDCDEPDCTTEDHLEDIAMTFSGERMTTPGKGRADRVWRALAEGIVSHH